MAEITTHHGIHHAGLRLTHAPPLHAVVLGLHDDAQALRFAELLNFVRQDHHGLFLDVRTGEDPVGDTSEFG